MVGFVDVIVIGGRVMVWQLGLVLAGTEWGSGLVVGIVLLGFGGKVLLGEEIIGLKKA